MFAECFVLFDEWLFLNDASYFEMWPIISWYSNLFHINLCFHLSNLGSKKVYMSMLMLRCLNGICSTSFN